MSFRLARTLYDWVQERTGEGRKFHNLTHAVERGVRLLQLEEDGKIQRLEEDVDDV